MDKPHISIGSIQESESLMEPMAFSERLPHRDSLIEPVSELRQKSKEFQESIPVGLWNPLVDFTRMMNSYYSNFIEGHKTHPLDLETAMNKSNDSAKIKNFEFEIAFAHIQLQKWIDQNNLVGNVTTIENIKTIHRKFFEELPLEARKIKSNNSDREEIVIPGEFRNCIVEVSRLEPIHPDSILGFMKRFEHVYSNMGPTDSLMSLAVAHHRFLWIHPFLDGNGRVARLMTQKMVQDSLNIDAFWSLSRGLARKKEQYMAHLKACDMQRRNDLDGPGNLSEEAMFKFTIFFFDVCLDQIKFMKDCVNPKSITERIRDWCEEKRKTRILPNGSFEVLTQLLNLGELTRPEIIFHTGIPERTTRRITSALEEIGAITFEHKQDPIKIQITPTIAESWFPRLFPLEESPI